jgi:coniferyl-aldehyde dehydrogenase
MTLTGQTSQAPATSDRAAIDTLRRLFEAQQASFNRSATPSVAERQEHLAALAAMVLGNRTRMQEAMVADFAVHPEELTVMTEVLTVAGQASYISEQLPIWAGPQERHVDPALFGSARAEMRYQPKGVLGIMAPWNLPFSLSLGPAADMLGAGNRVIIKPSESAPACAELLKEIVTSSFDSEQLAVVCGGLELAKVFPTMPWGHLLYTGNAAVGSQVAVAAAQNLVPITLELGGKNPAIVHTDGVNDETVSHIIGNKLVKNGQVCIAPDYCLIPRDRVAEFINRARSYLAATVPSYPDSADCVGIVNEHHLRRLTRLRDEAVARGCEIVTFGADGGAATGSRQMPLSLVLDPPDDLAMMQEEIFGPLLPVKPYDSIDEAIAYVNSGQPPLGLYVFASDTAIVEQVLDRTISGGACVNTCAIQGAMPSLGFGGAGHSGNGRHRGVEGFREFSHQRAVVVRGDDDVIHAFFPPYSGLARTIVDIALGSSADDPSTSKEN